ncbi:MAG: hypothetical protein RLZZ387_1520 [Chloroflexota bacterium]
MNFLGIGPGEIFLILILLLVVVGPERLPEFARTAGRFVIRVRDWVARSPDAQMVLRAREELELELDELRRSLTEEVETVRKELETVRGDLAEATKLVEESAEEVARTRLEMDSAGTTSTSRTDTPASQTALPQTNTPSATSDAGLAAAPAPEVNGQSVPRSFKPGQAPPTQAQAAIETPVPPAGDATIDALSTRLESLSEEFGRQIQLLTAELQALRATQGGPPEGEAVPPSADSAGERVSSVETPPAEAPAADVVPAQTAESVEPNEPVLDTRRRCKGLTRSGGPCGAAPLKGQDYCRVHASQRVLEEVAS